MVYVDFKDIHLWTRSIWQTYKFFKWGGVSVNEPVEVDIFLDFLLEHPETFHIVKEREKLGKISEDELIQAYYIVRSNQCRDLKKAELDSLLDENYNS